MVKILTYLSWKWKWCTENIRPFLARIPCSSVTLLRCINTVRKRTRQRSFLLITVVTEYKALLAMIAPIIYTDMNSQCYFVHRQLNNAGFNDLTIIASNENIKIPWNPSEWDITLIQQWRIYIVKFWTWPIPPPPCNSFIFMQFSANSAHPTSGRDPLWEILDLLLVKAPLLSPLTLWAKVMRTPQRIHGVFQLAVQMNCKVK